MPWLQKSPIVRAVQSLKRSLPCRVTTRMNGRKWLAWFSH